MRNCFHLLLYVMLLPVVCLTQPYYEASIRSKIMEKRTEAATEFENKNFDAIPYDYTVQSFYILSTIEFELLAIIQEEFEVFKDNYLIHKEFTAIRDGFRTQHSDPYPDVDLKKFRYTRRFYEDDGITRNLRAYLMANKDYYIDAVKRSNLLLFEQDFIVFFIEQLEYTYNKYDNWPYFNPDNSHQFEIIEKGKSYVRNHVGSPYSVFVRAYHGEFREPGWFAADLNFGLGLGGMTGELTNLYSRIAGVEVDVKAYLHSTFIGSKINLTFNRIRKSTYIDYLYVSQNAKHLVLSFWDIYVGRRFNMFGSVSVLPHIGYSLSEFGVYYGEDNWDVLYAWAPAYGLEINLTPLVKFKQRTHFSRFKRNLHNNMVYLRANIMVNETGLANIDPTIDGRSVQVNIGLGAHLRTTKRTLQF